MADEQQELSTEEKRALALETFGGKKPEVAAKAEEEVVEEKKLDEKKEEVKETPAEITPVEISDEQVFEIASKKAGRKISSWDDIKAKSTEPTEEDKKKAQEQRDSEKLTFGLKTGLFNKNQLESFIVDSKDPKALVYNRELAEAKAADPDWNADKEEEFKEDFNKKFGLDLDPTATKRKIGEKQIGLVAEAILKSEYASIYSLDSAYDKHESEINGKKSEQQRILDAAPQYKDDVNKVLADFTKVEMDFGGEKFEIPVSKEVMDEVSQVMLDNNFTSSQILKGYKKETLAEFVKQYVIGQNFQTLAFEAAKKYREKHEKGVRGVPAGGKLEKPGDPYENLTENQRKALDMLRGVNTAAAVPN